MSDDDIPYLGPSCQQSGTRAMYWVYCRGRPRSVQYRLDFGNMLDEKFEQGDFELGLEDVAWVNKFTKFVRPADATQLIRVIAKGLTGRETYVPSQYRFDVRDFLKKGEVVWSTAQATRGFEYYPNALALAMFYGYCKEALDRHHAAIQRD